MFAVEGDSETDVNNRVKAASAKWSEVSGVDAYQHHRYNLQNHSQSSNDIHK